ncbi:hypothetical protein SLEP1_g38231 [Rubroshorea leprosula]|uniref:Uncharacterized protein n=1 Tax=Rubroshorea leprosula TaxID=152421 RepID=A0AAV5KXJ0_9ROSI|nr:hypothetical protein SLEP1_g38231 [Rubroshorea leprosula]
MAFTLHDGGSGGGGGGKRYQKVQTHLVPMTGGFLFLISLLGLNDTLRRNNFVVPIYWTPMFFLIVGLIIFMDFTSFVILVTKDAARKEFSRKGCSQHRTVDYTMPFSSKSEKVKISKRAIGDDGEAVEEAIERVLLWEKVIDQYCRPDRITTNKQQEELEKVAKNIPNSAPASVKQSANRSILSLQSNTG